MIGLNRAENLGPPPRMPSILYDSLSYVKCVGFIRRYAAEHNATILFGHDFKQFASLKKSDEGYYD